MIEVKNRSVESWGPLAYVSDKLFNQLVSGIDAKHAIKGHIKNQKKLKKYKVTFVKQLVSDQYEVMAESDYDVTSKARKFFNENKDTIAFAPKPKSSWESRYADAVEYDQLQFVRART